jgi:Tfp pilus assembly protein PilF
MTRPSLAAGLVPIALASLLASCVVPPPAAPPPPPTGLLDVTERPAEKALLAGMRAYEDAQYATAEAQIGFALRTGLASPRDRAAAHKNLAFIYCTSDRIKACEAAFRAAREADPNFTLSKAEAGHPRWGPVYQRVRQ